EAGTSSYVDAIGLGAAVDYLCAVGIEKIHEHELALVGYLLPRLSEIPGVTVYGPRTLDDRVGVVSFNIEGIHPHDVATILDRERVCVRAGHHSNPLCGDELTMQLRISDGHVDDVRFSGKGCAISQASASILTEEVKGKSLDEVKRIDREHVLANLGIPISPARIKCALLGLKALKGAASGLTAWPGEEVKAK